MIVPDVGGPSAARGARAGDDARGGGGDDDRADRQVGRGPRGELRRRPTRGRGMEADVELALDDEATMLAVRARIWADLGGYLMPTTAIPTHTTAMLMCGVYDVQAADVEVVGRRTNKVPTGPYRGAGDRRPRTSWSAPSTSRRASSASIRSSCGAEPDPRVALRDGARLDLRLGRLRALPRLAEELVEPERRSDDERVVGTGFGMYSSSAPAGCSRPPRPSSCRPGGSRAERLVAARPGPRHHLRAARGRAVRRRARGRGAPLRRLEGGAARGGHLREPLGRDGRVGGRAGGGRPEGEVRAGGRAAGGGSATLREVAEAEPGLAGERRFESDLVFSSGAYGAVVEIERATGRRGCCGWRPWTTPARSSTPCWPRVR